MITAGFLAQKSATSALRAYLYGLAGEFFVVAVGAGLTFLFFGSVYWEVLILTALLVGIAFPSIMRGARLDRILPVFAISFIVWTSLAYALDQLLVFWIYTSKYARSHPDISFLGKQAVEFLFSLLTWPLLGTLFGKETRLLWHRFFLYGLSVSIFVLLTFKGKGMQRIVAFMDPWQVKQNFDVFHVIRSLYPFLTIVLAEGVLYVRKRWQKEKETQQWDALRNSDQVFLDDQEPVSIMKKGFRHCRDIDLFSAFFPERVGAEEVGKIVVYAHLADLAQEVMDDVIRRYNLGYSSKMAVAGASPKEPVPRGSIITIKPDIQGLQFEVAEARLALWEDIQAVEFRFIPEATATSTVCHGWLTIWLDCLRLADVQVSIFVALDRTPEVYREHLTRANARPYRRVFPSYSHEDKEIVERFQIYAHSFGDKYLRDVMEIRAGEHWEPKILAFIRQADVFQLFWSARAAKSNYVTLEWQQALQERERRPDPYFLRPCYWSEKPAAPIPASLQEIHFAKIPHPL